MFSILLFFAPSLGLFDLTHHGRMGAIPMSDEHRPAPVFGIDESGNNGTAATELVFAGEVWADLKLNNAHDLNPFPRAAMWILGMFIVTKVTFL